MLTDKSAIPLKSSDFKVFEGKRRVSDVRAAQRLAYADPSDLRELTGKWAPFLEQQSGKPPCRTEVSRARGPAGLAYWYTVPELIFIAGKSKAKNADVVQYEAALIAAHWIEGEALPDDVAPTLRALTAPDRPQLVPIEHEAWSQPELFAPVAPSANDAHLNVIAGPASKPGGFDKIEWREREADIEYSVVKSLRRNGAPMSLFFERIGLSRVATEAVFWVPDPTGNGDQVGLYLNHVIPLAVVERAIDRLGIGPMSQLTHNTLRQYLAF